MLNNCETQDLSDEKSPKHENTKEQSKSVTVPEQYIHTCLNFKMEFYSRLHVSSSLNAAEIVNFQVNSTTTKFSHTCEIQEQW